MSDVDALQIPCVKCGASAGVMCTYVWPPSVSRTATGVTPTMYRARVGLTMRVPHNERRRTWKYERARRIQQRRRNHDAQLRRVATLDAKRGVWRRSIIVEALTEYDRREARRLRDWLRVNASLLSVAELDFQLRRAEHDIATAMAVDVDQAVVAIGDALHAKWPLDTTKVLSEEDTRRES